MIVMKIKRFAPGGAKSENMWLFCKAHTRFPQSTSRRNASSRRPAAAL